MSKRANHWYLLSGLVESLVAAKRPRAKRLLFSIAATAVVILLYVSGAMKALPVIRIPPSLTPLIAFGVSFVVIIVTIFGQRWKYGTAYREALASSNPWVLASAVRRPLQNALIPDADAHRAHAAAIAYALYGGDEEATGALAAVDWRSRAPLIQALGLVAEGTVVLLCRRDPRRALELYREADRRSAVSDRLPGARTSRLSRAAFIAIGQAIMGTETPTDTVTLETMARRKRYPALQLLSIYGLAAAMDHGGNTRRADELRSLIRRTAPHCHPLHLSPAELRAGATIMTDRRTALSSIGSPETLDASPAAAERAMKTKVTRATRTLLTIWIGSALLLAALWAVLNMTARVAVK